MLDDSTTQSVVFNDLFGKPVVACFYQPGSSSNGGAMLLKACDERPDLTEAMVPVHVPVGPLLGGCVPSLLSGVVAG